MFMEPTLFREEKRGWIEVICGSMFSGKTEELIRRMKRAEFANLTVRIFKPSVDTRYHTENVVSHDSNTITSTPVEHSNKIILLSQNVDVIGIDEAQFFDENIVEVCQMLANKGIRVIVAGLDMDFKAKPFGPMPQLLAVAEYITKLHAICVKCGGLANHSFRKNNEGIQVVLGEKDLYEPRCRTCYQEDLKHREEDNQ